MPLAGSGLLQSEQSQVPSCCHVAIKYSAMEAL